MKAPLAAAGLLALIWASGLTAQTAPGLGEVLVTANRSNTLYALNERPVVGLRRRADAMVMPFWVESDTRDATTRSQEINTVLASLVDRAASAGLELVAGQAQLIQITKANYKSLPVVGAGRVDTSRVWLMVKAPLGQDAAETQKRLAAFVREAKGSGRATVETNGGTTLTIVNPDQYRAEIVKLVAEDAKMVAGLFGPDFTFNVTGIDGQVSWSQVSPTEVFLTLPYRYSIVPRK